jgi:16S rRNA (cytidine1402-2'-O)-methyltransferase
VSARHPGTLHLIPVTLGGDDAAAVLPTPVLAVVRGLRAFIVENEKSARRFLKHAGHPGPLQSLRLTTLDEHTPPGEIGRVLAPLFEGEDMGLISEAGCPAIADPGAAAVELAHRHGARVVPYVGPSAIALALMASGLNGQQFAFHGYLPVDAAQRAQRLRELEQASRRGGATQIFIETPYRNRALFEAILAACGPQTRLCVATDLTLPGESVLTLPIAQWRGRTPAIERRPTVFLLAA